MRHRKWIVGVLVCLVGMPMLAVGAFNPVVLEDTMWNLKLSGVTIYRDRFGVEVDRPSELIVATFSSGNQASLEMQDGNQLDGTWAYSNGNLTFAPDSDSLTSFVSQILDMDVPTTPTCQIKGTFKQTGSTLTLQLQVKIDVKFSSTENGNVSWSLLAGSLTGNYDLAATARAPRTFVFDNITATSRVATLSHAGKVDVQVALEPDDAFTGHFTMDIEGETALEGPYMVINKTFHLFPETSSKESFCEQVLDDLIESNPEQAEDIINYWLENPVLGITLMDLGKTALLRLSGSFDGFADVMDEEETQEGKGTVSITGLGKTVSAATLVKEICISKGYTTGSDGEFYEFDADLTVHASVDSIRMETPDGSVYDLEDYGFEEDGTKEFEYDYDGLTMEEIDEVFTPGTYVFTIGCADGSEYSTRVTVTAFPSPVTIPSPVFTQPTDGAMEVPASYIFKFKPSVAGTFLNLSIESWVDEEARSYDVDLPITSRQYGPVVLTADTDYIAELTYSREMKISSPDSISVWLSYNRQEYISFGTYSSF